MAKHHIEATVNGDAAEFLCETEDTLLDVLRDTLNLRRAPVRHLHPGRPGGLQGPARAVARPDGDRGALLAGRQPVPVHGL